MSDRKVKVVLDAQVTGFTAKMTAAGRAVSDTANKMTASTKVTKGMTEAERDAARALETRRRGLEDFGGTAGRAGLVAAAGFGAIVYATANFEQAMSNVQAATHETAENMDLLREAAIQAGADTAFSASEAAAGIENLAKAGVSTADILGGGLGGALDLAAAGELEVADAAEIAATAMTQFNLAGTEVPHIADLLAAAAGKAQGEVSDMAMALKQSGLVASQMGLSIEETTGTLAAFASAGLLGSDAGTSFRTMLLRLANPSQESADLMKSLGINAYDATGAFVGMESIAGQLQKAFEGKTQAERDSAFATIFGSDAIRAASVLYQRGSEGVADWTAKVDDTGYAAETASIKLDNLKGDLEALGGSLETALIGAGEGSTGILRELVQGATDAVNAFNKMPPAAQGTATALLGLTAITGGALWFGSKVINGIANTRSSLQDLGVTADKTKAKLSGIGKVAAKGGALLAVGTAVGMIADEIGRIDPSNLERSLEALSRGTFTGDLDTVVSNLQDLSHWSNQVDLGELITAGGLFGDSSMDRAAQNIDAVDKHLASLVETGKEADALRLFEQIVAESGISAGEAADRFDAYGLALDNVAGKEQQAAQAETWKNFFEDVQPPARGAAKEIRGVSNALSGLDAALTGRASLRDYQAALDDVTQSIKDNGKSLNINTRAGRENQAALDGIAAATLDVVETLKGSEKQAFLKQARADFRDAARELDLSKAATRALMEEFGLLDRQKAEPEVEAKGAREAQADLFALDNLLDSIDGRRATTHIETVYSTLGSGPGRVPRSADGSTVPDDGGSYADRFPYLLAPGEEVITNRHGEADRARKLLKLANRGLLTDRMLGLADGGTAGFPGLASGGTAGRSLDNLLAIQQLLADIGGLRRSLNAKGDDALGKRQRKIAELQLKIAQRDLRAQRREAFVERQERALDRERDQLDKARSALADLRQERRSYANQVAGNFQSDTFNQTDVFGQGGLAATFATLRGDVKGAREFDAALDRARRLGLDGAAFKQLAASGDLATANDIRTRRDVQRLEQLMAQRDRVATRLGNTSGDRVFGEAIAQQVEETRELRRVVTKLERRLDRLDGAVEQGARSGIKTGMEAHDRAVARAGRK